jgi:hypothetical protein
MVDHQIHQQLDPACMHPSDYLLHVLHVAKFRHDGTVVADVIPVVVVWGLEDRAQPHDDYAKLLQILQLLDDAT